MENAVWQEAEEPDSPGINKLIRANVDKCVAAVMMPRGGTRASVPHTPCKTTAHEATAKSLLLYQFHTETDHSSAFDGTNLLLKLPQGPRQSLSSQRAHVLLNVDEQESPSPSAVERQIHTKVDV